MDYLPIFMRVAGREVLVVGGGGVAARKVELLRQAGARVRVVAPRLGPALREVAAAGGLHHLARPFRAEDLACCRLAIAAADDAAVNEQVAAAAQRRGVPVNVVDAPALCTFIVPSIVDRAPVVVAVSSGGAAPVLARQVRARIEATLPPSLGALAEAVRGLRPRVAERLPSVDARRHFWDDVLGGLLVDPGQTPTPQALEAALCDAPGERAEVAVRVLALPSNDPGLLTLRALQFLQGADVVLHDERVAHEVLALGRREAERIAYDAREPAAALAPALARVLAERRRAVVVTVDRAEAVEPVLESLSCPGIRLPALL